MKYLDYAYGLDCDKHSAKEIAEHLKINGISSYVEYQSLKNKQYKN